MVRHALRWLLVAGCIGCVGCSDTEPDGTNTALAEATTSEAPVDGVGGAVVDEAQGDDVVMRPRQDACVPSTPMDPCTVCVCTDGIEVCGPRVQGEPCGPVDCCHAEGLCEVCPADDPMCTPSGLACVSAAVVACDDDDPCTRDAVSCVDDACECTHSVAADGTPCVDDPNACTTGDTCQEGLCLPGSPLSLDDGNPCTAGVCVKGRVIQTVLGGPCSDGNPCTIGDLCQHGQCVPTDLAPCDDVPCTHSAWCDPDVGSCVYEIAEDGALCGSADICGGQGLCQQGQCVADGEESCDDGDPCTDDVCDAAQGCVHTPMVCQETSESPCLADGVCDSDTGACVYAPVPEGVLCGFEGPCHAAAVCQSGSCVEGDKVICNDEDPCTTDVCEGAFGCVFTPVPECGEVVEGTTWNPADKQKNIVLTDGDLMATVLEDSVNDTVRATLGPTTGRWYWEVTIAVSSGAAYNGVCIADADLWLEVSPGCSYAGLQYKRQGNLCADATNLGSEDVYDEGAVVGVALDADQGVAWVHVDGAWQGGSGPDSAPGFALGILPGEPMYPCVNISQGDVYSGNFGQQPFAFPVPAGFHGGVY